MFATGVTMGLAEWIIDDTCLVPIIIKQLQKSAKLQCFILIQENLKLSLYETVTEFLQTYNPEKEL